MSMISKSILVFPFLVLPALAPAANEHDRVTACLAEAVEPTNCIGKLRETCDGFPGTEDGWHACLDAELAGWDAELNAAYARARASAKELDANFGTVSGESAQSRVDALLAMQRAWIPFRDAACDYAATEMGGIGTPAYEARTRCLSDETARQAIELRKLDYSG